AGSGDEISKGIVRVAVSYGAGQVCQQPNTSLSVIAIKADFPLAGNHLTLTDEGVPVSVRTDYLIAGDLVHHLCVPARVIRIHKIPSGNPVDSLRDAAAITVVDISYCATVKTREVILEVVRIRVAVCRERISIVVIGLTSEAVIAIIGARR